MTASLIVIAHICGSLATVLALGALLNRTESRNYARNREQIFEEASARIGVTAEDLAVSELKPELLRFFAERFSGETSENRISDFLGIIRALWVMLGYLLQAAVLSGVIWYTCTVSPKGAVHAWWMVAISLLFGIASILLSLECKLLTGRYPGQASQARKAVARLQETMHLAAQARAWLEADCRRVQIERDSRQSDGELRDRDPANVRHRQLM